MQRTSKGKREKSQLLKPQRHEFEFGTPDYLSFCFLFHLNLFGEKGLMERWTHAGNCMGKLQRDPQISPVHVAQHGFMLALMKG